MRNISAKSVAQALFQLISLATIPKEIPTDQGMGCLGPGKGKLGDGFKHQQKRGAAHPGPASKTPFTGSVITGELLQTQEGQQRMYNRGAKLRKFLPGDKMLLLLPSSSSKLLAKWQGPFVVTGRVGDVEYEVVRSDRGGATQIYHLNLLKVWTEVTAVTLATTVIERRVGTGGC